MAKNGTVSSVPVQTRVTPELAKRLDHVARELGLTRGHVATLILAGVLQKDDDEILRAFRTVVREVRSE